VLLACTALCLIAVPSPVTSHRIRPSPRPGRRIPLCLPEDPMLCKFLQSHSQRAVGQYAKPRYSFLRAKHLWILYRTDRSLALRTRTRKARQSRLDMGWFSPVRAKRCGSISHLFAFNSQYTSIPRSRAEQPDGLDGLSALYCLPFPSPPTVIHCTRTLSGKHQGPNCASLSLASTRRSDGNTAPLDNPRDSEFFFSRHS